MVFFSSKISPFHVHGDLLGQVALATAVVTSAMLRTWAVKLPAISMKLSVRSFQVPATPLTSAGRRACLRCDFTRHARHFRREGAQLIDHRVMVFFQFENFALHIDRDLLERSPVATAVVTRAMFAHLGGKVAGMKLTLSVKSFQVPPRLFT